MPNFLPVLHPNSPGATQVTSAAPPLPSPPPRATSCPALPEATPRAVPGPDTPRHTPSAGRSASLRVRLGQKPNLSQCRVCPPLSPKSCRLLFTHRLRKGPRVAPPSPSPSLFPNATKQALARACRRASPAALPVRTPVPGYPKHRQAPRKHPGRSGSLSSFFDQLLHAYVLGLFRALPDLIHPCKNFP